MRLRTKSVPILLKILNAPEKILTKTPLEVMGEDGIDSDIDFKKKEQIVIFREEKLLGKKIFPHGNWQWPIPSSTPLEHIFAHPTLEVVVHYV